MTYKPSTELAAKHAKYLELLPQAQDVHGFIEFDKCDSTLFSGLLGCVLGSNVFLTDATEPGTLGKWYRRPWSYNECYATSDATSEISRDMFIGIAWYAWCNKRDDIARDVCDYALRHFGRMGRGKLSQTLMSPSLLNTFAHISERLGGKSYPLLRRLPCYISPNLKDYQRHLAVLHALLRQKIGLKVNDTIFHRAYSEQQGNPLFAFAAHGPISEIETTLMNGCYWPNHRLPTAADRSEPWLLQRDFNSDWSPSLYVLQSREPNRTHSGGDFLFVSALLQGLI